MSHYLLARALGALVVVAGVTMVVFIVLRLTGDPTSLLLDPAAPREAYEQLRRDLGVDQPIPVQYTKFLSDVVRGDFGTSFQYHRSAAQVVIESVPATLQLAAMALLITICVGVPLGIWSAVHRDSASDIVISTLTLVGQSMPSFWFGIVLILFFAVELQWLPTSGSGDFRHLILPAITLAAHPVSKFTRVTRTEFLEHLRRDYVRTARAKGLRERIVLTRHTLRNVLIPLVTLISLDLGYLLGGAIIVETVFAWPGLGRLTIQAINQRDFPVVQAAVIYIAFVIVAINFIVDMLYMVLDPRIRLR